MGVRQDNQLQTQLTAAFSQYTHAPLLGNGYVGVTLFQTFLSTW